MFHHSRFWCSVYGHCMIWSKTQGFIYQHLRLEAISSLRNFDVGIASLTSCCSQRKLSLKQQLNFFAHSRNRHLVLQRLSRFELNFTALYRVAVYVTNSTRESEQRKNTMPGDFENSGSSNARVLNACRWSAGEVTSYPPSRKSKPPKGFRNEQVRRLKEDKHLLLWRAEKAELEKRNATHTTSSSAPKWCSLRDRS